MKITYIHHSAFCVETDGKALVFDYFRGERLPYCSYQGTMPKLPKETPLYVFSSHSHQDHFDPEVLKWSSSYPDIHYIFSKDIRKKLGNSALKRLGADAGVKERITYVKPGERHEIGDVIVETLLSTDCGVAFLVEVAGKRIYHAGDLNWWRWEGEPEESNEYQEKTYKEQINLLSGRKIDLAFVALDPRQEADKYLGIDYFIEHVQAEYIVPMHMWKEYGVIQEYRSLPRNASVREKILVVERENQVITAGETYR